jgi:uncharacterized protein YxjI
MYRYPLTFTFPLFSISPQFQATDSTGKGLFSAAKKLIPSKEEISVTSGGRAYFKIISQESRITDIPSNWDVLNAEGKTLGVVDDDFISAIDTSSFISNPAGRMMAEMELSRAFNLKALKMYWIKNTSGEKVGLIAPDKNSLYAQQLPLYDIVRKLPIFYRFITPRYYVRYGEETVMYMEKKRTLLQDTYVLEARGTFSDAEEPLLLNSIILAVLYEREQLKALYA